MPGAVYDEYTSVFHYTTAVGLEGILSSNSLRATHYSYLNDVEEVTHAKNILKEIFQEKILSVKVKQGLSVVPQSGLLASGMENVGAQHEATRFYRGYVSIIA